MEIRRNGFHHVGQEAEDTELEKENFDIYVAEGFCHIQEYRTVSSRQGSC
jgi:hypothetical protein